MHKTDLLNTRKVWFAIVVVGVVVMITLSAAPDAHALRAQPTSTPTPKPVTPTPKPVTGATIELYVEGTDDPTFAVVQWQDGLGDWHDVSSWRGEVKEQTVRWYVAPRDFGTGPFRWHVYGGSGETLALSESFSLPSNHGHWVRIPVTVE